MVVKEHMQTHTNYSSSPYIWLTLCILSHSLTLTVQLFEVVFIRVMWPNMNKNKKIKEKITIYLFNYLLICTFIFKVLNVIFYPPKLSNCGNLTTLTFFFPKCPYKKNCWSGRTTLAYFFIFKKIKNKICDGAFWDKTVKIVELS